MAPQHPARSSPERAESRPGLRRVRGSVEVEAGPPDEARTDGRPEWLLVHRGGWRVVVVLREGETEVPLQGHGSIERHWGPAWTTGRTVRLQGPGAALVRLHD